MKGLKFNFYLTSTCVSISVSSHGGTAWLENQESEPGSALWALSGVTIQEHS